MTKKEKSILQRLQSKVSNKLIKNEDLLKMKEIWLEELRYRKTKLGKIRIRDEKSKNNRMFRVDEGMFYRKINNTKERQGTVPVSKNLLIFGQAFGKMKLVHHIGDG